MTVKETYEAELKRQKEALNNMLRLKESTKKQLHNAKNDVYFYNRDIKKFSETAKRLKQNIREYKRKIKDLD